MDIKKRMILPSLALLLASNLYANEIYTTNTTSLKDAISNISKTANIPYMVDTRILKGKKAKKIKNIKGLENALKEVLKGTNLEAVIENNMIMIRKKSSTALNSNNLGKVDVVESLDNTTEGTGSYIIDSMNTATKLNLSIKETPQSVTVLTNQNILDNDLASLDDIANSVVGINAPVEDSERIWISSRGFTIDYYQIDGVSTNHEGETQQDMVIYDRVEVVRGANGLMSGSGSPAASINLVRKRANSKEFQGNLALKYGSWDKKRADLDLSFPLNEDGSIRARTIVSKEDKESHIDNYEKQRDVFYAVVDADVSDNGTFSLGASYQKDDAKGAIYGGLPAFFDNQERTNFDRSTSFAPSWASMPTTTKTFFTNYNHIFENDVKLNLGYSLLDSTTDAQMALFAYNTFANKTTGDGGQYYGWIGNIENKSSTIDINTSVPFELFGNEHELVAGISQSEREYYNVNRDRSNTLTANIYNFNPDNIAKYISVQAPYVAKDRNEKERAFYLASRLSLSEDLKLIAGARLTNGEYTNGATKWASAFSYEHKNIITPYLGLVYNFDDNHSVYGSYTDIFKQQNYMDKSGNYLDPVEGKNFEVGLKGEYLDKRLISSLTLFRIEQDNVAQKDGNNVVSGTTNQAYKGAKGVVSKGIEYEILGKVSDNLDLNFAFSHFEAKDANDKDVSTISPRTEVKLGSKYKMDKLTLGATAKWKSDIYAQSSSLPKLEQGNVLTVDAMMKYDFSKTMSAQLNVKNIFDKKYYVHFPYGTQYVYGEPRNITATLNWKF